MMSDDNYSSWRQYYLKPVGGSSTAADSNMALILNSVSCRVTKGL